jgi:hypothetical protein
MASRLFFSLLKNDEGARALLLALPDVFPWVRFLPTGDIRRFLVELVETVRASSELGNVAALGPVVAAWRDTAEIYADPELYQALTNPLEGTDHGPVPEPHPGRPGTERHHQLQADLATRKVGGRELEQWQVEVTGSGRIWYCLDSDSHTVWIVLAGTGRPRATS